MSSENLSSVPVVLSQLRTDYAHPTFVIEHSEEDGNLPEWSFIEYRHASQLVGGRAHMLFSRVLPHDVERLSAFGRVETKGMVLLVLSRVTFSR